VSANFDQPTEVITGRGRGAEYEMDGEKVQIYCFPCTDGGVVWKFIREGNEIPLRLSKTGMQVVIDLWHEVSWAPRSAFFDPIPTMTEGDL
jgi:hypothetical protein